MSSQLDQILGHVVTLRATSREDMKQHLMELLSQCDPEIRDTHNTKSMIFIFSADGERYGLKIEYGAAKVTRDEAHWYELAPANLKKHHVMSHVGEHYAFVLLRWLTNAQTVEEIAIANEGKGGTEAADLMIQVLEQDRQLFEHNSTVPLLAEEDDDFFLDKYRDYNAGASAYPYLQNLLGRETIRLNGRQLAGPDECMRLVQHNTEIRDYLSPNTAGLVHGDPHADNLLVENGQVYMIDPKGVDHLPLEYDTGRVIWSFTGWNAIVRGEFELIEENNGFELKYQARQQYVDGWSKLREHFTDQEYHRAMYSAAVQYVTRIHHAANESETKALYLRGLQLFDELFQELNVKG